MLEEYTFTRDWRGNLTLQGPYIRRIFKPDHTTLQSVTIDFYRAGLKLEWSYAFFLDMATFDALVRPLEFAKEFKLVQQEQELWQYAIELEQKSLARRGHRLQGFWMSSGLAENLSK